MKKALLTLTALLGLSVMASASHMMGGYIAATCADDPNTTPLEYKVQAYLIYDLAGIAYPQQITVSDGNGGTETLLQVSATTIQLGTYTADVVLYEATVDLMANTTYDFSYSTCCRSQAFQNINGSAAIYFNTMISTGSSCNSSPSMLTPLALTWPQNLPWFSAFTTVDPDWDFLFYELDELQDAAGSSIPYDTTAYGANGWPALDSVTGIFTMTAPNLGFYGIGFVIHAVDGSGQVTSTTRVDFPIGVLPPPSSAGSNFIQIGVPAAVTNGYANFNVSAPDTIYSGCYSDSSVSAQVFYPNSVDSNEVYIDIQSQKHAGSATVEFSWAPTVSGSIDEFPVVIRYESEGWSKDYVFMARKNNDVGTEELEVNALKLYPNPSTGSFTLEFEAGARNLRVLDLQGRAIASESIDANSTSISKDLDLESGVYFVEVEFANGSVAVQALVIE
ncbi:MAG: T9SS type A sorting domain-containing protein [Flavobacteriia bacterium]|nr:T9SS type A sorting domain-containing protein [Flavobacteriia bacterium]